MQAARRSSPATASHIPNVLLRISYPELTCRAHAGRVTTRARSGLAAATFLLVLSGILTAAAAAATGVSANWAGYVALPVEGAGSHFSSVSGSWREPSATCAAGHRTYSATWVGLGGDSESSDSLEQVGTNADCSDAGGAGYSSWYELLPAGPVNMKLTVHPGDELSASVTVKGHGVTLRLSDLSTGGHFSVTKRVASVNTSSAEWIVEAPSECAGSQSCEVLPLTNFGDVAFSSATATAHAHTGPIGDPDWSATALELQQRSVRAEGLRADAGTVPSATLIAATPSSSSDPLGAFSVSWQEQAPQLERPNAPTLPGGGPP